MLRLTSRYNKKDDICGVKYSSKNTNTLEHLHAINHLIQCIIKNDEFTDYLEIRKIMDMAFMPIKEEKKNGRNKK